MSTVRLVGEAATESLGEALAGVVLPGDVVLLSGDLGAGKTTLVRGLARGLGYRGEVTSPTFTLRHEYAGEPPLTHVDCWRLTEELELSDLGLDEVLEDGGVLAIEWGERANALFGADAFVLDLVDDGGDARVAHLAAHGAASARLGLLLEAAGERALSVDVEAAS